MNPFKYQSKFESEEMKALFSEFSEVITRICLKHADEAGEDFSFDSLMCYFISSLEFTSIQFKTLAQHSFSTQPETSLSLSSKVAVAAHEAYLRMNKVNKNGQS
ncbi:hypothetical protein AVV36_gp087 [Pectobacterium bacteriophage PM2]|uniref:Uncharacterized protein n=1 Tax=Pectobacterium bacteriophage PM2 TaxID=1429794 RepID=A0A0A0PZG2_9CAUD|nr:hypothetical protein AVV36_gp087 [Pectobacterium bacteriophage PM2]AHY25049.1 hypothetical protein PM2_087 [Pectobacterium bacteriophage PM2]